MTYQLHHGDCLNILPMMERESIPAIVTDPPYGLGFMGKDWDHGVPGEHFWREAYRVAKPGAHLLAFGGTRTFHRLAVAIEDAGWEIRDTVMWVYGQGFPKSHDVGKAIDREAGAEREIVGKYIHPDTGKIHADFNTDNDRSAYGDFSMCNDERNITRPATPAAVQWQGYGTALKPAWEPIIVARRPLAGTVAENVQRYGTGAMNIDACRIGTSSTPRMNTTMHTPSHAGYQRPNKSMFNDKLEFDGQQGRWPANLIHDGSAEVLAGFPANAPSGGGFKGSQNKANLFSGFKGNSPNQSTGGDTGSAARFFYCAKASKQDRDEGCEDLEEKEWTLQGRAGLDGKQRIDYPEGEGPPIRGGGKSRNHHPTVKPTALMRYLCRLITPPQGVILDPFMGSGSTGKAAILEGFNFVGIDTEIEYVEIAARRIEHACEKVGIVVEQPMLIESRREIADRPKQMLLL